MQLPLALWDRWTPLESWVLGGLVLLLDVVAIGRALLRGHGVESTHGRRGVGASLPGRARLQP